MATTTTRLALKQAILRKLWGGRNPLVDTTTATAATTATLTIGGAAYSSASINAYDGLTVEIVELVTNGPAIGEVSRVTRGGFTVATGVFAVSPNFTLAVQSGTDVLFYYGLRPDDVHQAINRIQNGLNVPAYLPLTLVTDGDMEASGVTNWTDAVGTPTQTKETTIVLTGIQSLKIVTTVVDHAVTSASVPVTEGEQLLISSPIKVTAGSLRLSLWNVTAGSEIDGVTVDEEAWTEVRLPVSVPDNCQNVAVRYVAKTAVTTAYVDHCALLSRDRLIYDLPSQLSDAAFIDDIIAISQGFPSEASYAYMALSARPSSWPRGEALRDWRAVNSQRIELARPISYPLFLEFWRTLPDLSADTSTTEAPEDVVVEGALAELKLVLARRTPNQSVGAKLEREAAQHKMGFESLRRGYGLVKPQVTVQATRRVYV